MKRNILFGSVLAAALSVGVGAQTPMGGAQAGGAMAKGSNDAITVTGCLQPATTGTSASAGDAAKADNFILANVMSGAGGAMSSPTSTATGTSGSAAGGTAPTAGATGSTAATGSMSGSSASGSNSYILSGGQKDELRTMVNSKVEITGKIDNASSSTSNNGASSSAGTTGSAMSTGSRAPETSKSGQTLKIDSIRKIAGSCS